MLRFISIALRMILCTAGAAVLLYVLSYPDSLMPANPALDYVQGITYYDFKPWMWLAPFLFMELVSIAGPRRNLVWFTALFTIIGLTLIAWPVLTATCPELVHPTFEYEDGKLAQGLIYMFCVLGITAFTRLVVLRFLYPPETEIDDDINNVDADVLDPSKALTVREILANPRKAKPHFLFGDADQERLSTIRAILRRLQRLSNWQNAGWLTLIALILCWFFFFPQPTEAQALQRDRNTMYRYVKMPDGTRRATFPAVHAAYRYMKHLADTDALAGLSKTQAEKLLQLQTVPEAYRSQLRDESDISIASVDDIFDSRTRFLTISDGRRVAVLYIRTNQEGDIINIAEVQDAGWNAKADDIRKRFGTASSRSYYY
ncbi:MAG: hypothetical protein IKZ13_10040 [Akkermansia sp.]|nr:hypothetical protein [Akkermansia sp.]